MRNRGRATACVLCKERYNRAIMELPYTYEKGEKFLVGHLDDYPEYPTQGVDLPEEVIDFEIDD